MAMMPLDLADIAAGIGVFVIRGQDAGDLSGGSVAAAGDFNGDGPDDLIIGAVRRCGRRWQDQCPGQPRMVGRDFTATATHPGASAAETLTGSTAAEIMARCESR